MTSPVSPIITPDAIKRLLMQGGDPSAMFNGDPSQPPSGPAPTGPAPVPTDPNRPPVASAGLFPPSAAAEPSSPAPTPSSAAPPSGTLSSAVSGGSAAPPYTSTAQMPSFATPESKQQYLSENPIAMPPRPVGFSPKQSILASLFAGLAEYGGEKNRHPGLGAPIVQRLVDQNMAQRQYDANAPYMKQQGENQAYDQYLEQQERGAGVGLTQAQTGRTQVETGTRFLPEQQKVLDQVHAEMATGDSTPQDIFNRHLSDLQTTPGLTRQMLVDAINNSAEKPPSPKIGPLGVAEPIIYHGKSWSGARDKQGNFTEEGIPEAVKAAFASAQPIENKVQANKIQSQQAARSNIVLGHEMTGEQQLGLENQRQLDTIKKEAQESDESYNAIVRLAQDKTGASDNALIDQYFNMAKPTSGARMNEAQMLRLQNFGPLTERIRQWGNELANGGRLTDAQHAQIVTAAKTLHDIKMDAVNNNMFFLGGKSGAAQPSQTQQGGQQKTAPPQGATHIGVSSIDGKKYYLDAQGKKLGPAE